jgi:hypothetical protein
MGENGVSARLTRRITGDRGPVLDSWLAALSRRSWALRGILRSGEAASGAGGGSVVTRALLRQRCEHFLTTLADGLQASERPELGTPQFREAVQSLSFTAGWMAGAGVRVADTVALVHSLGEVLEGALSEVQEALVAVVSEAYMAAVEQRAQVRYRDTIEKCQLVCALHERLPGLFLVGDPDRRALDDAIGRLMMLALMREAPVVLVDGSGLLAVEQSLPQAAQILLEYNRETRLQVVLSGVPGALQKTLAEARGQGLSMHEDLAEALNEAAPLCGLSWPLADGPR